VIYSMTGYAALSEELALGTLSVEIRSVNHRYLDLTFRLPDEYRSFEPGLREIVAARLTRGKVECRVEKAGIVHGRVGKKSFSVEQLEANTKAFIDAVLRAKPPTAKGKYLRSAYVSTSMSPSVRLDTGSLEALA